MTKNERTLELNKVLNELVAVTFEREALFGDLGRLQVNMEGLTPRQAELKKRAYELLTNGHEVKDDFELTVDNYGWVKVYKILEKDEDGRIARKQEATRLDVPKNYKLLPYNFVMGKKLSKRVRDMVLEQLKQNY